MKQSIAIACRLCLTAAVLLLLWAALQVSGLVIIAVVIGAIWHLRHRQIPVSNAYGQAKWCSHHQAAKAGLFNRGGFFLGRFAGPESGWGFAVAGLFTLPLSRSAQAVRQFLAVVYRQPRS